MANVVNPGAWVGNIWGTHTGLVFADIRIEGAATLFDLRVNVDGEITLLSGPLTAENGVYSAVLRTPANAPTAVEMTLVFQGIENDELEGRWFQPNLSAGIFRLQLSGRRNASQVGVLEEPLQVVQRTGKLPKVTIYQNEIRRLVAVMKEVLPVQNEVVINASWGTSSVKRLAPHFWENPLLPNEATSISLFLTDSADGIAKTINVSLHPTDCSFGVSGANRVWVEGAYAQIRETLEGFRSTWRGLFERHGLNINGIAFFCVLVVLPSLDLPSRAVLLSVTLLALLAVKWFHSSTTSLRIFLLRDREKIRLLDLTDIVTLLVGTAILGTIPLIYTWLKGGGLSRLLEWLIELSNGTV